ncbi:hypothetical protein AK89_00480 [Enterococcus mundtii CRL35]|nr:hypothetical protein AK89_00480 [Enterococcus mundtii CRL35]
MDNFLVIVAYFFLSLLYIFLFSLAFFVLKMEKYRKQIFENKYLLPDIEYTKEYYLITKRSNLFVFTGLTSCIIAGIFLINNKYYLTLGGALFAVLCLHLSLDKWRYFKRTISQGYLVTYRKNYILSIFLQNQKSNKRFFLGKEACLYSHT